MATFALVMNDPEDADLVIANQNLFGINFDTFTHSNSTVFKVPKALLTSFVDDIVIAEEVANELVMVHWDGARFISRTTFRLTLAKCISSSRCFGRPAVWMLASRGRPLIRLGTYGSMALKISRSIFGSAKGLWCRNLQSLAFLASERA
ncbi:MAG TPA: hypothetical protein VEO53_14125 [Candidatus Binatia bacterium]|nr:hypothetical protein [Candidatus Binatia bacterium]